MSKSSATGFVLPWAICCCWRQPAAARTCTISPSTAGCARACSSPTARARGRGSRGRSRAGRCRKTTAFFTGKVSNATVKELPFAIDAHVLDRGQERFNIYCSPCHGRTGEGKGMVVRRGYRQPPSFHSDRLLQADAGYIFDVITNGFGVMPDYKAQIAPRDRWAIVAYLRALQLSQHARGVRHRGRRSDEASPPARRWRARAREALRMETHAVNTDVPALARLQQWALVVGFWGLVAGGSAWSFPPDQFFRSWLIGVLFCLGLSMGSLALLMLQHMSGGQWGLVGRRIFEAASRILPLVALAFVPLLFRAAEALQMGAAGARQHRLASCSSRRRT